MSSCWYYLHFLAQCLCLVLVIFVLSASMAYVKTPVKHYSAIRDSTKWLQTVLTRIIALPFLDAIYPVERFCCVIHGQGWFVSNIDNDQESIMLLNIMVNLHISIHCICDFCKVDVAYTKSLYSIFRTLYVLCTYLSKKVRSFSDVGTFDLENFVLY